MLPTLALGLSGLLVGHLSRRAVPGVLGLEDRSLPFRLPWMEVSAAVAFMAVGWRLGADPGSARWLLFATLLLAISATDYLVKLIPDRLSFGGALAALAWSLFDAGALLHLPANGWILHWMGIDPEGPWAGIALSATGAALGFLLLEAIRLVFGAAADMQVMGMGDSKLLLLIGAFLGPGGTLLALMTAFFVGVPHGLIYLKVLGQPHSPFGPPLALSAGLVLLFHGAILRLIGRFQGAVLSLPSTVLAAGYTALVLVALALLWRTRRRAARYERLIEEDYRRVEARLEGGGRDLTDPGPEVEPKSDPGS
ncbi:MAG: A24 family peptidase [Holophagales bacterium]|nr:A24 family peptidase [Holophagales bacterium]